MMSQALKPEVDTKARRPRKEQRYYSDGITKITDRFWTLSCPDCGHAGWSLIKMECCPECGSVAAVFTNPDVKTPSS
jgi:ribosomal protein S27E